MVIRRIRDTDNADLASLIRRVLEEMGAPKVGTAYVDPSLDSLSDAYGEVGYGYFVAEKDGELLGGAGIGPLAGVANTCELQKMYLSSNSRGKGIGSKLMNQCLGFAKIEGYSQCYLETLPYMEAAQKLYQRVGFKYLDRPLGSTGHHSCNVWMLKLLT